MEGLRLDHMCYLQTMLLKTRGLIDSYEKQPGLSDDAKAHLRALRENQKQIRGMILHHG